MNTIDQTSTQANTVAQAAAARTQATPVRTQAATARETAPARQAPRTAPAEGPPRTATRLAREAEAAASAAERPEPRDTFEPTRTFARDAIYNVSDVKRDGQGRSQRSIVPPVESETATGEKLVADILLAMGIKNLRILTRPDETDAG